MKIKWNETFELEIIDQFDEEMDNITDSHTETVKEGEIEEADIIKEEKGYVDIQFGNGSMAFSVLKSAFTVLEK